MFIFTGAVMLTLLACSRDPKSNFSGVINGAHQPGFHSHSFALAVTEEKEGVRIGGWVGFKMTMACSLCPRWSLWKSQMLPGWSLVLELTVTIETAHFNQRPRGFHSPLEYMVVVMETLQWRTLEMSAIASTQVRFPDILISLFHDYVLFVQG